MLPSVGYHPGFRASSLTRTTRFGNTEGTDFGQELAQLFFADGFIRRGSASNWQLLITTGPIGKMLTRQGDRLILEGQPLLYLDRNGTFEGLDAESAFLKAFQALQAGYYVAEPGVEVQIPRNLSPELDARLQSKENEHPIK